MQVETPPAPKTFSDRAAEAVRHNRSQPLGGLDPPRGPPPVELRGRAWLEPFLGACRRHGGGVFCLVKTSNEGGGDVQDVRLSDGGLLWQHVARLVAEWGEDLIGEHGLSSVGAVVGATQPRAVSEARRLLPRSIMLLPGVGAQGASPAAVDRAFTSGPASALVAASRSITYGFRSSREDWRTRASQEAARLKTEIWAASGW